MLMVNIWVDHLIHIFSYLQLSSFCKGSRWLLKEAYQGLPKTSKTEWFEKTVNGFYSLTVLANHSTLVVWGVFDIPLVIYMFKIRN